MTEQDYIDYFENLCKQSTDINHLVNGKKSFFYVNEPYNMDEIDNALRNSIQYPAFVLESPNGTLDNNNTTNYTDGITGTFSILTTASNTADVRTARNLCKEIGIKFLARMSKDSRANSIIAGKNIHFRIEDVSYDTIGPMGPDVYGYVFSFRFMCPFGFSVDSGTWRDIIE